jgi:glyoxylase-like metal-dependent hydrolase (beta-lactamase superfamily II)
MPLQRFYLGPLAHASYLVWDEVSREAAVIDPRRDVEVYLEEARRRGVKIRHAVLTHLHADFIAGHLELAAATGATIRLGAKASVEYDSAPLPEGEPLALGPCSRLRALETPGHTPESISLVLEESAGAGGSAAAPPPAVFTGDTLFVGDVGRPDLRVALGWSAERLGRMLYRSLTEKLLALPDATHAHPAHGAGSLCGKSLCGAERSSIGAERRSNYALRARSEEEFLALVLADQPPAPRYFTHDAVLNMRRRPLLSETLARAEVPLSLVEALALIEREGATLLDARDADEFAAGHLAGALNVGLDGAFETWVGSILEPSTPLVLLAPSGCEREAAVRLGRIGYDRVLGTLAGGASALAARADLARRAERIDARSLLAERAEPRSASVVLDVRSDAERRGGHMPGSLHIPLGQLPERAGEIPAGARVLVHCQGGYRSSVAASLLRARGCDAVEVDGGFGAVREILAGAARA